MIIFHLKHFAVQNRNVLSIILELKISAIETKHVQKTFVLKILHLYSNNFLLIKLS